MGLDPAKALRIELRDTGTQKGGRYRRRKNFYIFKCITCPNELANVRADLKRMSGRCRACADANAGPIHSLMKRGAPYSALYNRFAYDRERTGQKTIRTDISLVEFIEFTHIKECHYCSAPVSWAEYALAKHGSAYNLDRKDNSIGYLKTNVVVCCWGCNETKGSRFTYEQFVQIGKLIKSWR